MNQVEKTTTKKPTIGEIIKKFRTNVLKVSQGELAKMLDTTWVTVWRWEKNKARPQVHHMARLASHGFEEFLCEELDRREK